MKNFFTSITKTEKSIIFGSVEVKNLNFSEYWIVVFLGCAFSSCAFSSCLNLIWDKKLHPFFLHYGIWNYVDLLLLHTLIFQFLWLKFTKFPNDVMRYGLLSRIALKEKKLWKIEEISCKETQKMIKDSNNSGCQPSITLFQFALDATFRWR